MTDDEIASTVGRLVDEARDYITSDIEPLRTLSTNYYHGKPFGNEEELRSQVVSTDVRDTILSMMPSFMRIFAGSHERAVEFRPRGKEPSDEAEAQQKTDTVNYIIFEENDGFMMTYGAIKDACVRKTGAFKWFVETMKKTSGQRYTGISEQAMSVLAAEEGAKWTLEKKNADGTYDGSLLRTVTEKKYRVRAINPGHLAWNRGARNIEDALIVVHDEPDVPVWRLLAMGYDLDDFEDQIGASVVKMDDTSGSDAAARGDDGAGNEAEEGVLDETRPVRYSEAYTYGDFDGEGTGLWKICLAGDAHKFLAKERVEETPIAVICVDPESHQIVGGDIADLVRDIQLIKSNVWRATMDSLAKAVDPDLVVGDGVAMDDALSKERGKVIRAEDVEQIKEFSHRFVGDVTLPFIEMLNGVIEERTGRNKNAGGLDADTLQSSTKAAVAATLSASQQRVELISRIFAETGFRRLYRGVGRMLHQHQDKKMTIRLRGEWVEVDPRSWNSNMDVVVNTALGSGMLEDRVQALLAIKADLDAIVTTYGPSNPLVGMRQAYNVRRRLVEMGGYQAAEFYKEITPEIEKQLEQAAAQPKQPPGDPALMLQAQNDAKRVELDQQKFKFEQEAREVELKMKMQEMQMNDDRLRDFKAQDISVQIAKIEAENAVKLDRHDIEAEAERQRELLQGGVSVERAHIDAEAKIKVAAIKGAADIQKEKEKPRPSAAE
jgi:hypothetical protein